MKRLIAVLLTICIAAGLPVAAFAENGPSSGEWSSAWIQLIQGEEAQLLFSSSEPAVEVAGAAYDRETNTITLTNYNHPNTSLNTNEMGDDLKLKLVGENHISALVVWGFGWGGSLEIIGDGSLIINETKKSPIAIRFMAEGTKGVLKIGPEATLTAYRGSDAEYYSAAFVGSISSSFPLQGKLAVEPILTDDSGMEEEAWLGETVIKESEYTADVELASKKGDNRLYGIRVLEPDEVITEGQVDIFELIPAAGLPSGNEYLAVSVATLRQDRWPEEYTKDPENKIMTLRQSELSSMGAIEKDGEIFFWGTDGLEESEEYPKEYMYSVYRSIMEIPITDAWSGETAPAKLVVPVDGLRNLTTDQSAVPEDYRPEIEKTGMYSYYCTNDVIQISPSGDAAAVSAGRENVDPVDLADGESISPPADLPEEYENGWTVLSIAAAIFLAAVVTLAFFVLVRRKKALEKTEGKDVGRDE